jgi:hypothetical protein
MLNVRGLSLVTPTPQIREQPCEDVEMRLKMALARFEVVYTMQGPVSIQGK